MPPNAKKPFSLIMVTLFAISSLLIVGSNTALAQNKLNEKDFKIKDFGGLTSSNVFTQFPSNHGRYVPDCICKIPSHLFVDSSVAT